MHEWDIPIKKLSIAVFGILLRVPVDGYQLEVAFESAPEEKKRIVQMACRVAYALERYQRHRGNYPDHGRRLFLGRWCKLG